jgi:hypothetical protein
MGAATIVNRLSIKAETKVPITNALSDKVKTGSSDDKSVKKDRMEL